ncbi:MAG: monofunctional biosynthetic peptidoglycan transglycosylase [Hyphomicrobium sp.]|nr:monofunctional biosynthetic peptidoglycan transglycosylase [Hyphomicrobium sp.]
MSPRNYPVFDRAPLASPVSLYQSRAPLLIDTLPPAPVPAVPTPLQSYQPAVTPAIQPRVAAPQPVFAPLRADPVRRPTALTAPPSPSRLSHLQPLALKAARYAAYAAAGWLALILVLIAAYRFINPPVSSLMLQKRLTGNSFTQTWVPMDSISPQVVRAVLLSEDGRFCQHWGVDFAAMQDAIERAGDGIPRGASTISMQVTKNLFLWPSKSYIRKAIEIPLTYAIEALWPKRRIMEVYLNIAEWGPGIFGVEAASRAHFDKAASRLNEREAAQLAVALPNPHARDPGDPGPQTRRLAGDIQLRMRNAYNGQTACVLGSRRAITRAE